jgi:site-specific recombinase XerD
MKNKEIIACTSTSFSINSGSPLKSFKSYLQSQGKSKSTVEHYNQYLLDFLSYLDRDRTEPENATAKEVLSYQSILKKRGYENKTRSTRLSVIKQFFNFQIELGKRTENPITHLKIRGNKQQKLYPILDKQQLESLYNEYKLLDDNNKSAQMNWFKTSQLSKARNKAIISLMVNQGLTTAEVDRIENKDLQLKEGKILIKGTRKSNERVLELKSHQIMELMEYQYKTRIELLKYCKGEVSNLFISTPPIGKELNQRADSKHIWKRLSQEVKAQHKGFINFKQVRTSIITHWLKEHNLRQVQYMAGHKYVSSTEAYLVNNTEDLQKDIDEFHPF